MTTRQIWQTTFAIFSIICSALCLLLMTFGNRRDATDLLMATAITACLAALALACGLTLPSLTLFKGER